MPQFGMCRNSIIRTPKRDLPDEYTFTYASKVRVFVQRIHCVLERWEEKGEGLVQRLRFARTLNHWAHPGHPAVVKDEVHSKKRCNHFDGRSRLDRDRLVARRALFLVHS